jgi:hypothetical protein
MSEFINTVDVLGDDEVIDSILNGTIVEFKDNIAKTLRSYAFYNCKNLITVDLPNVTGCSEGVRGLHIFTNCTSLINVNLPKFDTASSNNIQRMFQGCISLEEVTFQSLTNNGYGMFDGCKNLKKADFFKVKYIHQASFLNTALRTLLIRSDVVCGLNPNSVFSGTPIASGTGYIYVPRALVEDYKSATNWSAYAAQIRALEDYTVDGTVTGEFIKLYAITNSLLNVDNSNESNDIVSEHQYVATLTSTSAYPIESVTVTMGGVDITTDAYNADTGEVSIASVTGDIVISAKAKNDYGHHITLVPLNSAEEGELPGYRINVTANQVITVTYLLTKKAGFVYDGRSCGLTYSLSNNVVNAETTTTITIPRDGIITFSVHHNASVANGTISPDASARLYGKYFHIDIS